MNITHASFLTVPVSDQDAALRFYALSGPGMGGFAPGSAQGIML
ncbi:hypothetical protein AB0O76_21745 [Streptomyces sp. NPDC086554]